MTDIVTIDRSTGELAECPDCEHWQSLLLRERKGSQALRNQLATERKEDDDASDIKTVLEDWKTTHKRADISPGKDRWEAVRKILKLPGWTVDRCLLANEGARRLPYVGPKGRQPTGSKKQRFDDATLIFRDPSIAERFEQYGADPRYSRKLTPDECDWMGELFIDLHERLDVAGVPVDSPGDRIYGLSSLLKRFDLLIQQRDILREALGEQSERPTGELAELTAQRKNVVLQLAGAVDGILAA